MNLRFIFCIILVILLFILVIICNNYSNKENFESERGLNRVDAVIYINLDHRKDRKKQIESELKRMGVKKTKIIRFPAVYEKYNGHLGCKKSYRCNENNKK